MDRAPAVLCSTPRQVRFPSHWRPFRARILVGLTNFVDDQTLRAGYGAIATTGSSVIGLLRRVLRGGSRRTLQDAVRARARLRFRSCRRAGQVHQCRLKSRCGRHLRPCRPNAVVPRGMEGDHELHPRLDRRLPRISLWQRLHPQRIHRRRVAAHLEDLRRRISMKRLDRCSSAIGQQFHDLTRPTRREALLPHRP